MQAGNRGRQVENIFITTKDCTDGVYKFFVRYYDGHGNTCNFTFNFNECAARTHEGSSYVSTSKEDKPVVDVTIRGGQITSTYFHLSKTTKENTPAYQKANMDYWKSHFPNTKTCEELISSNFIPAKVAINTLYLTT